MVGSVHFTAVLFYGLCELPDKLLNIGITFADDFDIVPPLDALDQVFCKQVRRSVEIERFWFIHKFSIKRRVVLPVAPLVTSSAHVVYVLPNSRRTNKIACRVAPLCITPFRGQPL